MHKFRERPKLEFVLLGCRFRPWLKKDMNMIRHDARGEQVVSFLIQMCDGIQRDATRFGRENPMIPR